MRPGVTLEPVTDLHLRIPEELAERLAAEAAERKMPPEEVVAEMLDQNIPPRRHLRFVGIGRSGQHDNAARAEEILQEHFGK
jgi:hypothetical protein